MIGSRDEDDEDEEKEGGHGQGHHGHHGHHHVGKEKDKDHGEHEHDEHHHGNCCKDTMFGHDHTTFGVIMQDVCMIALDERNAVSEGRRIIIDALMRPSAYLVKESPHESITNEYLNMCYTKVKRERSSSNLSTRLSRGMSIIINKKDLIRGDDEFEIAQKQGLAKEVSMEGKYKEILIHRGGIFYDFITENDIPLDKGINLLAKWRRYDDHGLTKVGSAHLMRAIDADGDRVLSKAEFIFLLTGPKGTKVQRRSSFLSSSSPSSDAGEGKDVPNDSSKKTNQNTTMTTGVATEEEQREEADDLALRSKEELVALIQKSRRKNERALTCSGSVPSMETKV